MHKDLEDLEIIKELIKRSSSFLETIDQVYNKIKKVLNTRIPKVFSNYTLHDTDHSIRIIKYMARIVNDISKLSDLELNLLVLSALLHDIGMAVSKEQITQIRSDKLTFTDLKYSAMLKFVKGNKDLALQEFVRRVHSQLSRIYIYTNLQGHFQIPSMDALNYRSELGLICQSHTEDYDWIFENLTNKEIKGDHYFNSKFVASILRIADILDIDSNRTPYNLYNLISPTGFSDKEWKQHFIVSNNDKIELNDLTGQKYIVLHGKSSNPKIHRKLLHYITWIEDELVNSIEMTSLMNEQYVLNYENSVRSNIQTEGFTFSDYRMQLNYQAISNLLMGEKIYGSKEYGLREIVQNSYDACIIKNELNLKDALFGEDVSVPKIKVISSKSEGKIIIKDNGIGMNMEVIKKHFLNVGVSYYKSTDFILKDFEYKPIGNYGIGFLACFMLSNNILVSTRNYKSKYKYSIELEKGDEWTSLKKKEDLTFEGTEISLDYLEFKDAFVENDKNLNQTIIDFLKKYFLTDKVELSYVDRDKKGIESINNSIEDIDCKKGEIKIDLSKYLKGIEGFIVIKRNENFLKTLNDLAYKFRGDVYVYTEDGLIPLDDKEFNLDNYCSNDSIRFLTIPIITDSLEEKYNSGMEFTENDLDEVIERLEYDVEHVSVLFENDIQEELDYGEISWGNNIIENFDFDNLVELGQSTECSTKSTVDSFDIYKGVNGEIYMPFSQRIYRHSWGARVEHDELYIRNVLIDDFKFSFKNFSSIFSLSKAKINVLTSDFIPNISRNDLSEESAQILNYLINKVMHLAAYEDFNLKELEKMSLKKFIDENYAKRLKYEKKQVIE